MTTEKITITLSESAPVKIDPGQWPVVARVERHDGKVACQANTEWRIVVREHADGRRIVYGWQEAGNGGQYAGYRPTSAGWLLPPGDEQATIRAIRRVAGVIGDEQLGAECIAELPAQDL